MTYVENRPGKRKVDGNEDGASELEIERKSEGHGGNLPST
jgi:hypothetical protein